MLYYYKFYNFSITVSFFLIFADNSLFTLSIVFFSGHLELQK